MALTTLFQHNVANGHDKYNENRLVFASVNFLVDAGLTPDRFYKLSSKSRASCKRLRVISWRGSMDAACVKASTALR